MISNTIIFNLGKDMVEEVAARIYEASRKDSLGKIVKKEGAAGHEILLADEISEKIIKKSAELCLQKCPRDVVEKIVTISEGSGIVEYGNSEAKDGIFMVIDPIDGTNNNVRPWKTPSPAICVSVALGSIQDAMALPRLESIRVGFVRDIFGKAMIYATRGGGAHYEGYGRIHSSPVADVKDAVLGVDLDDKKHFDEVLNRVAPLMKQAKCQRRIGASVLDMWRVATSEYDAYITISGRIKMYDVAAIKLIIEEAGGIFEEELVGETRADFLKELLKTKDPACVRGCGFKVITSGNQNIHDKIKNMLLNIQ